MSVSTSSVSAACWSCGAANSGEHFCSKCGKIQPLSREGDYFAFFGLPQKLVIDSADLERRFHALSWKLHPDNFVRAAEAERELSLERSSQLNDAYRTLADPIARVEYLLAHEGMRKEGQTKQQAPPELLEEIFELNELLDEWQTAGRVGDSAEKAGLKRTLEGASANFQGQLGGADAELEEGLFPEWDRTLDAGGDAATRRALMEKMNAVLNRRSYLRNLVTRVQSALTESD